MTPHQGISFITLLLHPTPNLPNLIPCDSPTPNPTPVSFIFLFSLIHNDPKLSCFHVYDKSIRTYDRNCQRRDGYQHTGGGREKHEKRPGRTVESTRQDWEQYSTASVVLMEFLSLIISDTS